MVSSKKVILRNTIKGKKIYKKISVIQNKDIFPVSRDTISKPKNKTQ